VDSEAVPALVSSDSQGDSVPAELDQLNWTAVLWGGYYALFRGVWGWFALFAATDLLARIFFTYLNRSDSVSPLVWGACSSIVATAGVILAFVFGRRVNRLRWRRGRLGSSDELNGERAWILLGVVWEVIGTIMGVVFVADRFPQHVIPMTLVISIRPILLAGIWLVRAGAGRSD